MSLLITKRYYCTNPECTNENKQIYVDEELFIQKEGKCAECARELTLGKVVDHRVRLIIGSFVIVLFALFALLVMYRHQHPAPFAGIDFSSPQTEVAETESFVDIQVNREQTDEAQTINLEFVEQTAQLNEDFTTSHQALHFLPGQASKTIRVHIIPDHNYNEIRESFVIRLQNALGNPTHVVIIVDAKPDIEQLTAADASVRRLSNISIDLAQSYIKVRELQHHRSQFLKSDLALQRFNQLIIINEENLRNARQKYSEGMKDLISIEQASVVEAFRKWLDSLERRKQYDQQIATTQVMRKQYEFLLNHNEIEIDIWEIELAESIYSMEEPDPDTKTESLDQTFNKFQT